MDLLEAGRFDGALAAFREARTAVEVAPTLDRQLIDYLALNLYNLGARYNNAGDAAMALECFLEASRLGTLSPRLRDDTFRAQLVDATLSVAEFLVSASSTERPIAAYETLARWMPRDARPLLGMGKAFIEQGDLPSAYEALEEAAALESRSADIAASLGRLFLEAAQRLGRVAPDREGKIANDRIAAYGDAVTWFAHARDLDPGVATRENDLAKALVAQGLALARAGEAREGRDRLEQAASGYRRAVSLEPDSPWLRIDLAIFLLDRRRYEESRELLTSVANDLGRRLESDPGNRNAETWRQAIISCRENCAVAAYNLAVDALNRSDFAAVETHLEDACHVNATWRETCDAFRRLVEARRESFERIVSAHEQSLREDPDRAVPLFALAELYANLGSYDKALGYYRRLRAIGADIPDINDRIAAVEDPGPLQAIERRIELPGGRIDLVHYNKSVGDDLAKAAEASWLRVTTALGVDALSGSVQIMVYPNKRAFRENAGYRVGGLVKGNYGMGRISVFETPSHTVLEWVSVMTHEMTHHAVERLSRGTYPRWFSEGVARYVQGDSSIVDRERMQQRLREMPPPPLTRLDDLMEHSWNEPDVYLDALDASLLAVEEMARAHGLAGLRKTLIALGSVPASAENFANVLQGTLGLDLGSVDRAWRARLGDQGPPRPAAQP
jgi:tetratricopeptide (TPR) repeat protein